MLKYFAVHCMLGLFYMGLRYNFGRGANEVINDQYDKDQFVAVGAMVIACVAWPLMLSADLMDLCKRKED